MDNLTSLALLHSAGFTHKDLKKIFETRENYNEVLSSLDTQRGILTPWMTDERRSTIITSLTQIDRVKIVSILSEKSIELITIHSPKYPERLRTIKQAPYMLYVRGDLHSEHKMLGIVGSRKNTSYGKKVLEHIIPELVRASCGIVSGGAYGIDAISHEITITSSGYTVAVFGCSVDIYYPVQNTRLFDTILERGGALVSIFPISTRAESYMFPIRNEVVAALSDGIIIPEAGVKSGTLITAQLALDHGRDVFAVPGDIFRETSIGTNGLIARGEAKSVSGASDILEEYFPNMSASTLSLFAKKVWDDHDHEQIYGLIIDGYDTPDSIGQNSDYTIDTITMTLTMLEIDGHIRLGGGGKYEVI